MRENALRCIANTHVEEGSNNATGGWTIHRGDPGNWTGGKVGKGVLKGTKYGIAANTYPDLDIKNLTRAQADQIYMRDYWPKSWGDQWPMGFDQITYDATVNSGPGRGPLWTCRALGFAKADLAATTKAHALPTEQKIAAIKRAVSGQRMGFLRGLGTFQLFGKGWTKRCARMEAIGVKMVLEASVAKSPVPLPKDTIDSRLEKEAGAAKTTSNQAGTAAGGTTAGSAGTATQIEPSQFDLSAWLFVGGLTLAAIGLVAFFAWHWWKHRERWQAYIDAARGLIGG